MNIIKSIKNPQKQKFLISNKMKHTTCNILILVVFLSIFFAAVNITNAETTMVPSAETQWQAVEKIKAFEKQQRTFVSYLNDAFRFAIVFSAIVAVIIITIAGFQYILAGGNVGVIEKAKNNIWQAILGLLLVLASYLILYTINPDLVTKGLTIDPLPIKIQDTTTPASSYHWKFQAEDCSDYGESWTNANDSYCNINERPSSYYICCGYTPKEN